MSSARGVRRRAEVKSDRRHPGMRRKRKERKVRNELELRTLIWLGQIHRAEPDRRARAIQVPSTRSTSANILEPRLRHQAELRRRKSDCV